jgi:hypothetical protein
MLASVAVSHEREREVSASISEMTSSILRSIVMRPLKRRARVRVPVRISFVYRKYFLKSAKHVSISKIAVCSASMNRPFYLITS